MSKYLNVFEVTVRLTVFVLCSLLHIQAIHGYRETERARWGEACEEVLTRVRSVAFPEGSPLLGPVHILDLDKTGYIKPHIDSVKVGFPFFFFLSSACAALHTVASGKRLLLHHFQTKTTDKG